MEVMLSFLVENPWCYQRLDKAVLETKLVELGRTLALASIRGGVFVAVPSQNPSHGFIIRNCAYPVFCISGLQAVRISSHSLLISQHCCTAASFALQDQLNPQNCSKSEVSNSNLGSPICWIHSLRNTRSGRSAKDS